MVSTLRYLYRRWVYSCVKKFVPFRITWLLCLYLSRNDGWTVWLTLKDGRIAIKRRKRDCELSSPTWNCGHSMNLVMLILPCCAIRLMNSFCGPWCRHERPWMVCRISPRNHWLSQRRFQGLSKRRLSRKVLDLAFRCILERYVFALRWKCFIGSFPLTRLLYAEIKRWRRESCPSFNASQQVCGTIERFGAVATYS